MIWVLALCGASSVYSMEAGSFADAVVAYAPGVLPANLASYTNASAALGEPSRSILGLHGGPVDPFSPPYLPVQLVSLGSNGVLTEIDGLARVAGGPGQTTLFEDFRQDPRGDGWRVWGDAALFAWSPGLSNLEVTWDSSRSNSYFYRPLPAPVTKADSFSLAFGLELDSVAVGVTPNQPFTFELAVGLCRWADATNSNFLRGTGQNSPNLVEFDYFPKSDYDATISPTVISSQVKFACTMNFPMELVPGDHYQVRLSYDAATQRLNTVLTQNGQPFGPIAEVLLGPDFDDFRVDTLVIASYNDALSGGSLLAHGSVTDLVFIGPAAPVFAIAAQPDPSAWHITFPSQSGWRYTLERTDDFQSWLSVGETQNGVDGPLTLTDPDAPSSQAFYRVRGDRL